ncbi:hypothetical protein SS50377_22093 [Spironucleus salmonicida]|uniref:Uncharacterized protein n=1 Tax=Spironucleus salmonicida TaxID=348837 RepID=V6LM73_9EUKA|nr:hypothetical protein SS50377_22093 [Spironucleus salmonicida]|eukprot:EST45745.1 Hypothetical protein SS50377_14316 [Spironucleus salmonicida]
MDYFTSLQRRSALLLPLPSSGSKNLSKTLYSTISTYIFTKKPNFKIELGFLPRDNIYYSEIKLLHAKKQGIHSKFRLLKIQNQPNKFANSLPKFVVFPVDFSLYKKNQPHAIFKTWSIQNGFKQLIREQVFNFQSHKITQFLVKKIEEFYENWEENWSPEQYLEVSQKISKRAIRDERNQIQFWLTDYKEFDFLQAISIAEKIFKMQE